MNQLFQLRAMQNVADVEGPFYVIESFPYPQFAMNKEGEIKTFDTYVEASMEAADCQEGFVLAF